MITQFKHQEIQNPPTGKIKSIYYPSWELLHAPLAQVQKHFNDDAKPTTKEKAKEKAKERAK